MNYLKQNDGKFWMTDKNEKVPERCPVCGAEMGLFFAGEPVFLCKGKDEHYFGTLKFPEEKRCVITKN